MISPTPRPFLADIETYIGGKSKLANGAQAIKLSSNENPLGPSPAAIKAYEQAAAQLHRYPEDGCASLRTALGEHFGFPAAQLICGAGSDDILRMLVHAFAGEGDEVIHSEHGFAMYHIYARQYGATPISVKETDLRADIDAMRRAVTPRTKLVFLANPNNPTGSYLDRASIHRLRDALPESVILVLDGAYSEYMDAADYSDGRELVTSSNTVITRTFSKIYGMPALRLGFGYGPPIIIQSLYKVRSPFNVTQAAIDAGIAALNDHDYLKRSIEMNRSERDRLDNAFRAMGLFTYPAFANFILVRFGDSIHSAAAANQSLLKRHIIVREVANYGLPDCLRITVGTPDENTALLAAMQDFLA